MPTLPQEVVDELVQHLDAQTLRELASLADARRHPTPTLTGEGLEILTRLLVAGDRPTIGFYRRHTATGQTAARRRDEQVAEGVAGGVAGFER